MEHNETESSKDAVLAQIRERRIAMRPRYYFAFETFLAVLTSLVILLVSIGIVNFILFGLRVNGHESLLSFGPRGVGAFLGIFPWPLLALDILLVVFLERLLRRFKFGYRSPVLYLLFALLGLALAAGLTLDRATPFNDDLLRHADQGELPSPFGEFYEHLRTPAPHDRGIFRGTITSLATSTMTMRHDDLDRDADESIYTVMYPAGFASSSLSVGERVYVAGDADDGIVRAFGINPLPPSDEIPSASRP